MTPVDSLNDPVQQLRAAAEELVQRLRAGEACRAEELLARFPVLSASDDLAIQLICTEFATRQQLGEVVEVASWCDRFPAWRERLLHKLLVEAPTLAQASENATGTAPLTHLHIAPVEADQKQEPRSFGRHQLLQIIGRGAMGVVYKARQLPPLERVVALKTLPPGSWLEPTALERFAQEVQAAGKLRHPNIITVYEVGEYEGQHYLTMPFVPGGSLLQHLARFRADTRAAVRLVEKIARAVHHAHTNGILHRDLKPGNILLDERDEPLVADFGLARSLDADVHLTETGLVVGTPAYLSPEQAAGHRTLTAASDIWALGVILYELLAGRRPFSAPARQDLRDLILTTDPPPPRSLRRDLDPVLEAIVLACLEKEPGRRYVTAQALADDLANWLEGKPTVKHPRRWRPRFSRQARRQLPKIALVGLVLALTVGLLVALNRPPQTAGPPSREQIWQSIRDRLQRGEKVTFIGENGPPAAFDWPVAGAIAPDTPDGSFTIHSGAVSLLELLPDMPIEHYKFTAEVRQERTPSGTVGLYCCYARHSTPTGEVHAFACVNFADWGNLAVNNNGVVRSAVHFKLTHYRPPGTGLGDAGLGEEQRFKPLVFADKPDYRKLEIVVTPETMRVTWEGHVKVAKVSKSTRLEKAKLLVNGRPEMAGVFPVFPPSGGLGFFVCQSAASFRQVAIEPLPNTAANDGQ
jgi:serine/threonine-protein kinase